MNKTILFCFLIFAAMILAACGGTVPAPLPEPSPAKTATPIAIQMPTLTPVPAKTATPAPSPTATPNPTVTPIPLETIPSYAAQVELSDISGEPYSRSAAFLVDSERGLFATNAHVVYEILEEESFSMKVQIGNVWYPAHTKEEWVDWEADVAIIGIDMASAQSLPESARLGEAPPAGSEVRVTGYILESDEQDVNNTFLTPYSTVSLVRFVDAGWVVNYETWVKRALTLDLFVADMLEGGDETFKIPKGMKQLYYTHYVVIEQREPQYDQRFRAGMSGMPVLGEEGNVVAIMSVYLDGGYGTGGPFALVVPSEEVIKILEKAVGTLQ